MSGTHGVGRKVTVLVEGWTLVEVDAADNATPEDIEEAARNEADIPRHSWTASIVTDQGEK